MAFARELAPLVGREILDEVSASRVALIGKEKRALVNPEPVKEFRLDLGTAPPIKKLPLV